MRGSRRGCKNDYRCNVQRMAHGSLTGSSMREDPIERPSHATAALHAAGDPLRARRKRGHASVTLAQR
jgi:hypothetical protein